MFKYFVVLAVLAAPGAAFAAQGMSTDDSYALASTASSSEIDTVIAPMQDGGGTEAMHGSNAGRAGGEVDNHTQSDNAASRGAHSGRAVGADGAATNPHAAHKSHGKTPWQSLLPGVMK